MHEQLRRGKLLEIRGARARLAFALPRGGALSGRHTKLRS